MAAFAHLKFLLHYISACETIDTDSNLDSLPEEEDDWNKILNSSIAHASVENLVDQYINEDIKLTQYQLVELLIRKLKASIQKFSDKSDDLFDFFTSTSVKQLIFVTEIDYTSEICSIVQMKEYLNSPNYFFGIPKTMMIFENVVQNELDKK